MWKLKGAVYSDDHFEKYGIMCLTTSAAEGDMKDGANRQRFLSSLKIEKTVFGEQTHSDNIEVITEENLGNSFSQVDGYITCLKNVGLAVFTADCMPVFFFDKVNEIIGVVHSGRVGAEKGIAAKALGIMQAEFGSSCEDIYVSAGPHIMKCCYGVDLIEEVKKQITEKGVKDYCFSGICTHNKEFFSYRKDKTQKRMISLISAVKK